MMELDEQLALQMACAIEKIVKCRVKALQAADVEDMCHDIFATVLERISKMEEAPLMLQHYVRKTASLEVIKRVKEMRKSRLLPNEFVTQSPTKPTEFFDIDAFRLLLMLPEDERTALRQFCGFDSRPSQRLDYYKKDMGVSRIRRHLSEKAIA